MQEPLYEFRYNQNCNNYGRAYEYQKENDADSK